MLKTIPTQGGGVRIRPVRRWQRASAFTLIELLVVIGIIGILASITIPSLKGFGRSNKIAAANRQLLDDLAYARLTAINGRTTVYMVFMPKLDMIDYSQFNSDETNKLHQLVTGQLTSYALMATRSIGDQPGQSRPYLITDWKSLPDGMMFTENKFQRIFTVDDWINFNDITNRPFHYLPVPFPLPTSADHYMPVIAFNPQGQVFHPGYVPTNPINNSEWKNETLTVSEGSIFYARNKDGKAILEPADVDSRPGITREIIWLNWITGRANVVRVELP